MIREKLYRDAVHDLIALDKNSAEDRLLIALIDTPEMQRLRRIRQLGLAHLAFQGAEHSRFTHSLGVMWIATRVLERLGREQDIAPRLCVATRAAALLHDIGHGPMSHLFESFTGYHHEEWTNRIIASRESNVHRVLANYDSRLPGEVARIIKGESRPRFLSQIISSQLDADRFDYLLRDSIMTGVKYGIYDFERLLHILRLDKRGQNIVVAANGVQPVEKYLQSRYHMYSQVYLHKTVRAAEAMMKLLLRRASDLAKAGGEPCLDSSHPLMLLLRQRERTLLEDYLALDDATVFSLLTQWRGCPDATLSDLSSRILNRDLFKSLDISHVRGLRAKELKARELVRRAGADPRYYFTIDTSGDLPYRPYDPSRQASDHILVESRGRGEAYRDIHDVSRVVAGLTLAAFTTKRAIFPAEVRGKDIRRGIQRIFKT